LANEPSPDFSKGIRRDFEKPMKQDSTNEYNLIRKSDGIGFYEQTRGLIAVVGKEAAQF
jgi:hypothetical protein